MNPEIVFSVRHRHVFTHILLENVGGSEQNQSVIANVQSDDLWPSRMHAATHILQEKTHAFGVLTFGAGAEAHQRWGLNLGPMRKWRT